MMQPYCSQLIVWKYSVYVLFAKGSGSETTEATPLSVADTYSSRQQKVALSQMHDVSRSILSINIHECDHSASGCSGRKQWQAFAAGALMQHAEQQQDQHAQTKGAAVAAAGAGKRSSRTEARQHRQA